MDFRQFLLQQDFGLLLALLETIGITAREGFVAKFFQRLREFEAEFPMVYVECWTPDDYEVASGNETSVDWNAPHHVETAGALNRRFDATIGTNWDRLAESAAQPT